MNRTWRAASETPKLYAYHLSRCPSFSATHNVISGPFADDSLLKLKKQFVQEAKRNLFAVFARPRQTIINLISTTTSSSGAFPYGEAFDFSFDPKAQWCLAISSSRIIVLDTASEEVSVKRELKVVRKPLSAYILSDGSRLAVLSTNHKVNIYDLSQETPKFLRSVSLDDPAHTIALSSHGEVLAVAYDGGIEVYSLADNASSADKRAVKCDWVDCLSFSDDGTMLLGTTQGSKSASTVILSAPYFAESAEDMPHAELISHMWTSQILFPNSSRDCSHATLLPWKIDHDANWTLTYDRVFESFRAVRTDDLRNGTTYFTGPKPKKERERRRSKSALVPCTLPSITPKGELVAAGFLGAEIWLYGVPEDLGNPGVAVSTAHDGPSISSPTDGPSTGPQRSPGPEIEGLPRWQVLVDKYRNVFAKGRRIAKVPGASQLCWSSRGTKDEAPQHVRERLIIAAPGGVSGSSDLEQEEMASVDGGRLVILDFNWSTRGGKTDEITIEVGNINPQNLEEEDTDMATEIAMVRRRTVARRDGIPRSNVASVVDVLRPAGEDVPPVPPLPTSVGFGLDEAAAPVPESRRSVSPDSPTEGVSLEEAAEAFDGPYSHTDPRSRNTLYRSATAVEANRRRNPHIPNSGRVEYRRTDGTELPHESDADNWVPPPPPYTKDAEGPLPQHLQNILGHRTVSSPIVGSIRRRPVRSQSTSESTLQQQAFRRRSSADIDMTSYRLSRISPPSREGSDSPSSATVGADLISPLSHSNRSENSDNSPSSRNMSPTPTMRRPMSSYEPRSSRSSMYRAALRPASPISPITEPLEQQPQQPVDSPSRRSMRASRSASLTLSGSNLQQRLDYPLPPPPSSPMQTASPIEQHSIAATDTPASAITNTTSHSISVPAVQPPPQPVPAPTAHQLNNLQNRQSVNQSAYAEMSSLFPQPSPPPGAIGATGNRTSRFRSPFRRSTDQPPSRARLRASSAFNASTPDLTPRPAGLQRMNTIYSIGSRASYVRPESRVLDGDHNNNPNSGGEEARPRTRPPITETLGSRFNRRMSRMRAQSEDPSQMYGHEVEDQSSGWTGRGRRRGRGGAEAEVWEEVYPQQEYEEQQQNQQRTQAPGRKRRGTGGGKCTVM